MNNNFDFSGWATAHGIKCSDGRTIIKDAFKDCDGKTVPLVWNHSHNDPDNVLGHALLENRDKGVYARCSFNDTQQGKNAKELVMHGDVCCLSIYANKLVQEGQNVVHGVIREVSLVLAGANPGAYIDNVVKHDGLSEDEATIYNDNEEIEVILHSEDSESSVENNENNETETKVDEVEHSEEENQNTTETTESTEENSDNKEKTEEVEHAEKSEKEETVGDVFNTLTEKQQTAVYAIIAGLLREEKSKQEENSMKQNAFENENKVEDNTATLSHSELLEVFNQAKKDGKSLSVTVKDACLAHGITNIENLFPEFQAKNYMPKIVDNDQNWVGVVIAGVGRTPFARVKSMYATLTADEARAKGYIKTKQKVEEVFPALKRTTTPQTIYKKQALDRDDIIDITDFNVVTWLKAEMRVKLEEEIARAILVGDGRQITSDDKISEEHIRSIANDSEVYTIKRTLGTASSTNKQLAYLLIDDMVLARPEYKGRGNITMFVADTMLAQMLLLTEKDDDHVRLYKSVNEIATAMAISRVVPVPAAILGDVLAVAVDLQDYNVGADRGGAVSFFDDFDIDYNKEKYLIETRCSGANVTPYSAFVFKKGA